MSRLHLLLLAAISTLCLYPLHGQQYLEMIQNANDDTRFADIQQAAELYFQSHDKGKGSGYKQYKRWEEHIRFRLDDDGTLTNYSARIFEEGVKAGRVRLGSGSSTLPGNQNPSAGNNCAGDTWTELGPSAYVNGNYGYNPGLGRVNVIAFDPEDSNVIYLGAPAGSLWKTTDGGNTWTPLTDQLSSIGVSGIAIDPDDGNHIFILTGDGDGGDTYSIGVMESLDGGLSWNTTAFSYTQSQVKRGYKLIMYPGHPDTMFAVMRDGIYRTFDAWQSWTRVLSGNFRDLEFNPDNPQIVYASTTRDFYRSVNGGSTWAIIPDALPSATNRIEIGVSEDESSFVYLISGPSTGNGQFTGISRSVDNGQTFTSAMNTPNILGYSPSGSDGSSQSWYDLAIAVSPEDASTVITGGVNVWKSTDSCNSATVRSYWVDPSGYEYTHADIHELVFNPLDNKLYCGSDGGIFVSSDYGDTWTNISDGIVITQFYRIASSEKRPNVIIGGTQDNGSNKWVGNDTIVHIYGADGMDCMVDHTYPDTIYFSSQGGGLRKSLNGGFTSVSIRPSNGPWVTPYAMHPDSSNILYGGWNDLYRSDDGGLSWVNTGMPCNRAIAIAESNPDIIYTASGSSLYRSADGGTTFVNVSQGLPGRSIAGLTVNPKDPNEIWTCYGGFSASQKVYRSLNGGNTWANLSSGVPNVPVNAIRMVDHFKNGGLTGAVYIGTDLGMYYRDDYTSWTCAGNELPNVPVFDIEFNYGNNKIRVGTFGRGIWESSIITSVEAICKDAVKYLDENGRVILAASDVDSASHAPLGIDTMYVTPDTFYCSDTGEQRVVLTVIDLAGHMDQCESDVEILDTTAPKAQCQPLQVYLDSSGHAFITASQINMGSSDNCGISEMSVEPNLFSCEDPDTVWVRLLVQDAAENRDSCETYVLITDSIRPWLSCADTTLYLNEAGEVEIRAIDLLERPVGHDTFFFTGETATWTVPSGVDSIGIELFGAGGGDGAQGALGGKGGRLKARIPVSPNDTFYIRAGGAGSSCHTCPFGGFNGGGGTEVLNTSFTAGTGGGASDIRLNDTSLSARIAVAGGGGGGGFVTSEASGGAGGGLVGADGGSWNAYPPGRGGTQSAGGQGGSGAAYGQSNAGDGSLGFGGRGKGLTGGGGGGGAGYYGGGGGFVAGGGGGSSYAFASAADVEHWQGVNEGNGFVVIHWKSHGNYGDNCEVDSLTASQRIFTTEDLGVNEVIVSIVDVNGLQNSCVSLVTVLDTVSPDISCQNTLLYLDENGRALLQADSVLESVSDAGGVDSLWVLPDSFDCENIGNNEVQLYARDSSGNISHCVALVEVLDTIPPMALIRSDTFYLDANGSVSLAADSFYSLLAEACGIDTISLDPAELGCEDTGWHELNLRFVDRSGNVHEYTSSVYVIDSTAPMARCKNTVVYLNESGIAILEAEMIDDESEDACGIQSLSVSRDTFGCDEIRTPLVELIVSDRNGNTASCLAEVQVKDTLSPVLHCRNAELYLNEEGIAILSMEAVIESMEDNCGIASVTISKDTFSCADIGENEVHILLTDVNGNQSDCTALLIVRDSSAPQLLCHDTTVYLNADGVAEVNAEALLTASDNCESFTIQTGRTRFTCDDMGVQELLIEAEDPSGNRSTCISRITVTDSTSPVARCKAVDLYLNGDGVAELEVSQLDAGSEDACGIQSLEPDRSRFSCSDLGESLITLYVVDNNGNESRCRSALQVIDTVPPVARCHDTFVTLDEAGHAAVTAEMIDNGSEDACSIDSMWVIPSGFGPDDIGEQTVVLHVRDSSGNIAECESIVEVRPFPVGIAAQAGAASLRLYPNPFEEAFVLELDNPGRGEVSWEIFDLLGRKVAGQNEGSPAVLKRLIQVKDRAAGSYFIRIRIGEELLIRKLIRI